MNAQHTPGRLKVGAPPPNGEQTIVAESGLMVAIATTGVGHPSEANARRFVATWNACEGLDIGEIEKWGLGAATGGAIYRLTQQRDELLDALKAIMEMLDDEIKTATDEELSHGLSDPQCPEHIKEELACVIACRAAVAKAEGGAACG